MPEKLSKKSDVMRKMAAIGLLLILVSALLQYVILMSNRTQKQYKVRLEETAQQLAEGVNRQLNSSVKFLNAMSEVFSGFEDIHSEEALNLLVRMSKKSDFKRMWLTKANGEAKASDGRESDATGREYFKAALQGETGISEVQFSKVDGERNVVIYAPIYHNEKISGMVIGIYVLDELSEVINIECFDGKGYSHIVAKDGTIVAYSKHPDSEAEDQDKIKYWEEYGDSYPIGIRDWYIFVTLPKENVEEAFRYNLMVSVLIWMELGFVLFVIIYDRYRIKNQELQELAQKDSMTELYNRGTIEKRINQILKDNREECASFILFDVDHFKEVNDTLGHMAGDELLCKIAMVMKEEFRKVDILGRLGGDEFAIFMRGVEDDKLIMMKIENLMKRICLISKELEWNQDISISVGIAVAPNDGEDFETLYKIADSKMYQAKREEGNCVIGRENDE